MIKPNVYEDELGVSKHWSFLAGRGITLTLTDKHGIGNCAMLMYNPENPLERLNLPDTLKCQQTFKLTQGNCLYSDMGRVFCSIVADDLGWHDASSGTCNAQSVRRRWGERTFQEVHNDRFQNGRDCFLIELGKYGLGRRDLAANVNWFSRVNVDADGTTHYVPNHSYEGASVTLRFDMRTLVVLHTCPHPLNNVREFPQAGAISYTFGRTASEGTDEDDLCRNSHPENARGFLNNALYGLGAGFDSR